MRLTFDEIVDLICIIESFQEGLEKGEKWDNLSERLRAKLEMMKSLSEGK